MGERASVESPIMTVPQVAQYLQLAEATIYKLAQAGEIPAAKLGRTWRFRKDLIDEWFRQKADVSRDPDPGIVRESD